MTTLFALLIIIVSMIQFKLIHKLSKCTTHLKSKWYETAVQFLMVIPVMISFALTIAGILTRDMGLISFSTITLVSSSFCLLKTKSSQSFFATINMVCSVMIIIECIIKFNF